MTAIHELTEQFNRSCVLEWENNTEYALQVYNGGVFTTQPIPVDTTLGNIKGTPAYVWEIGHTEFMFVSDDMVWDTSNVRPRSILTLIRDTHNSPNPTNCTIEVEDTEKHPSLWRCFIRTEQNIATGEELVYDICL